MADKVLVSFHDAILYESDVALLQGRNWLNDNLISFWMEHLRHNVFPERSDLLFISPDITQLVKMGDASDLHLFLDPLDASIRTHIFLAVNDNTSVVSSGGSHWSLLVYSKYDKKWFHYDSLRGSNFRDARTLVQRLNTYLERDAALHEASCTQQNNSYDCGAFVMIYAERLSYFAAQGRDLSSCFLPTEEANSIRDTLKSLISSLK